MSLPLLDPTMVITVPVVWLFIRIQISLSTLRGDRTLPRFLVFGPALPLTNSEHGMLTSPTTKVFIPVYWLAKNYPSYSIKRVIRSPTFLAAPLAGVKA